MSVLRKIFRHAPERNAPPPAIENAPPPDISNEPDEFDDGFESGAEETRSHDKIGPLFFMIEYTNAKGEFTRRRITAYRIENRDNGLRYIIAKCHERRALRTFRLDRVNCFITQDGEVVEPDVFLSDFLNIDDRIPTPEETKRTRATRAFNERILPAITLLVGAARADEHLDPREAERILLYAEKEALELERSGVLEAVPEISAFNALNKLIRLVRPDLLEIAGALLEIDEWEDDAVERLTDALLDVINADGVVTLGEELFLADIGLLTEAAEHELGMGQ